MYPNNHKTISMKKIFVNIYISYLDPCNRGRFKTKNITGLLRAGHPPRANLAQIKIPLFKGGFLFERETGIGPAYPAWKAGALPLCYSRMIPKESWGSAKLYAKQGYIIKWIKLQNGKACMQS